MRPLSLEHLTMLEASPRELIDAAAAGGFDMAGLRVVPPQPPNLLMPGFDDPRFVRDVRKHSDDTGVAIGMIAALWLAPATPPADEAGLRNEARTGRFYPGDGELPLAAFLAAMPAEARLGLEAPCRAYAHLPPVERGRIAGRVTRDWLARHAAARL